MLNSLRTVVLKTIPFGQITTIDDDEAIKVHAFENYNHPLYKIVLKARKM